MLDPRIYRTALAPIVLAVILLAFSLSDQQGPLTTTLSPQAFSGPSAASTLKRLTNAYPDRRSGSVGDGELAGYVGQQLSRSGFSVSTDSFTGRTADGTTTLQNVTGVRAGQENGSIVVVADRSADGSGAAPGPGAGLGPGALGGLGAAGSPGTALGHGAAASLSGTAVLLQLAGVLAGETLQHTVVLASTSGAAGAAGAIRLAHTLQSPVDAVIVLGDMAGAQVRHPIVVPWSNSQQVAPPLLRNTVGAALTAQAGLQPGGTGLIGELARLAFPMVATEQGPFGGAGLPAVLLSLSGERPPAPGEPVSQVQMAAMGRTVLQSVSALDGAASIPGPSTYLGFAGKTIPAWAIRLLVLALIAPVLVATIDGLARARRRGHSISLWVAWALTAALPFAVAAVLVVLARAVGVIGAAPPAPVAGGAIPLGAGGVGLLVVVALTAVGGLVWVRPALVRLLGVATYGAGAAAGLMLVLCLVALAIWISNPFAALLLVPALHTWLWIVAPDVRLPTPAAIALLLAGLALPLVVALDYASTLGLGPIQALWSWALLLAGGGVGLSVAIEWSIALGCAIGVAAIVLRAAREPRPAPVPVTVRGPVTYAGPGSLGGTDSALRRGTESAVRR
jgi:hypothetical protein